MKAKTDKTDKTDKTFSDRIGMIWTEMRDAVREAVKTYGRITVKRLAEDDGCIFLDGNKIEFLGTADDVATAVDSLLERLREGGDSGGKAGRRH